MSLSLSPSFLCLLLAITRTVRHRRTAADARTGTLESAKAMSRTSKLSTLEAMQILNLQKGEMKPDLIKKVRGSRCLCGAEKQTKE